MADETEINGKFFDDLSVEVSGDESTPKIWALNRKISDLEQENDTIIRENEEYKKRIEDLKASMKELSDEKVDLKKQLESENTAAAVVVELESEVSMLQHDLVTAMSDLQGSSVEILDLKRDLEGMRSREKEKSVKLEAMVKEKALLMSKVEKLERVESGLRVELMGKEREIQVLKKNVEELGVSKSLETLKNELETKIATMKAEIISLDEKEKVMSSLETKERAMIDDGVSKQWDWLVVGGSTIAAVAALVACYVHVARRH